MSASITVEGLNPCFICDEKPADIKKLKTHLLLKHSKMNLCLFCVENKGWSDNFASQSSYNEHYWDQHKGVIENKANKQQELRNQRKKERQKWRRDKEIAKELGLPLPKKPRKKNICSLCTTTNIELDDVDYDRHLISRHGYDYCKICYLIGPWSSVGLHITKKHSDKLCYVCCSSSPKFSSSEDVRNHMLNKHLNSLKQDIRMNPFPCYHCGVNQLSGRKNKIHEKKGIDDEVTITFSSCEVYLSHILKDHPEVSEKNLIGMTRRQPKNEVQEQNKDDSSSDLKRGDALSLFMISGITNETGQDCFSTSVLHLLAQTDLINLRPCPLPHNTFEILPNPNDKSSVNYLSTTCLCKNARCLLLFFLRMYNPNQQREEPNSMKRRQKISPNMIIKNYSEFGIDISDDIRLDCGDFLRACLKEICSRSENPKIESVERRNSKIKPGTPMTCDKEQTNSENGTKGTNPIESKNLEKDVNDLFQLSIEWKFECESCHRFIVINLKEYVLKIDGSMEGSLDDLLQKFLHNKVCRCGKECFVEPIVKRQGEYLFIEIDRSIDSNLKSSNEPALIDVPQNLERSDNDCSSKELSLYSLRLEKCYKLFGHEYSLFGTVNYNLELDEGGHYITYLFPREKDCIRIHETEIKSVRKKPDFDVDTVIVALKKQMENI